MLGAWPGDAEGVGFLEGVAADQLAGYLAGESHDRDGIHQGVHQPRGQVRGARTGSGAAHPHFPRRARVSLRRERRILFVPHQDVADVVIVKHVVKGNGNAARIAEQAIHPFAHQALHQHSRTAH